MVDASIYGWTEGRLIPVDESDATAGTVVAADSWLVVDGAAVAVERHCARFARGVQSQFQELAVEAFARAALDSIPTSGRWFPRIEAVEVGPDVLLRVRVRPAPDPLTEVVLATATLDPRTRPDIKGPDLVALGALRTELNAGEAVILENGVIAEGAWSSIVWWKDDRLHAVDPSIARLPSVTESVLRDHAAYIGAPIAVERARPSNLEGAEVWVLSALHGIRVATEWRDGPTLHIEPGRADYWRQQYTNRRRRLN